MKLIRAIVFQQMRAENGSRIIDIPKSALLVVLEEKDDKYFAAYKAAKTYTGYVRKEFVEEESVPLPVVEIDLPQTESLQDAEQYAIINNKPHYNLCGMFCVAHVANISLGAVISAIDKSAYRYLLNNSGTSESELAGIAALVGLKTTRLSAALWSQPLNRPLLSPGRLKALIDTGEIIVGVSIDKLTGELVPRGTPNSTPHWVVIERTETQNRRLPFAEVWVYNPFGNCYETYHWSLVEKSIGNSIAGILAQRQR